MPEPTLYLFDGYNVLHAAGFRAREELIDRLAGFVALRGARGIVVFDGVGEDATLGPLDVRYARSADDLLERLAAEHRESARTYLVSSDSAIRQTAGQEVTKLASKEFVAELREEAAAPWRNDASRSPIEDALDAGTRDRLERWRRRRT